MKDTGFLAFNDIQTEYYQIPKADKEVIIKIEEEVREELKENQDDDLENNDTSDESSNFKSENELKENTQFGQQEDSRIKKVDDIRNKKKFKRYRIQEVIKPNQIILVQIVKEERGKKRRCFNNLFISCW